ncbi:BET1-like protein [Aphelenchoides fujianensis]|nr:BET1-like protein [Aphelenchoides fujianensis]
MAYRSNRNGVNPSPPSGGGYDNHTFLEQQNDSLADDLSSKVNHLKRVTIAIGDDVREQNRLLNQMDSDFDLSRTLLGSTMKKLGIVSRAGGHKLLCYLVLFSFFVFLVIYWLAR